MRAFVRLLLPDGDLRELGHGDLIGRLYAASLCLDDPRISEAHAMVSLRSGALHLVALRGRIAVGRGQVSSVELRPGLKVRLASDLEVVVDALQLPSEVLAIEGPGVPRQVLYQVTAIVTTPRLALQARFRADAAAHVWSTGASWTARVGTAPPRPLLAGDTLQVGGVTLQAVTVPIVDAGGGVTLVDSGASRPLRIVARFDSVHIHRDGEDPVVLDGLLARIVSELVCLGGPVRWEILAAELWNEGDEPARLRSRFDTTLSRLRQRLRDGRIRPDLVRTAGTGHVELLLHSRDEVIDHV